MLGVRHHTGTAVKKYLIITFAGIISYLFAFCMLLVVITTIGPLPPWLSSVANVLFAPVIVIINHFFGGIC